MPLEPAAEPAAASATDALFALAPTALTTAALQARLLPVDTAAGRGSRGGSRRDLLGRATTPAAIVLPPLAGSAPSVDPLAAAAPTGLDPLAALAGLAAEAEPAPLETAASTCRGYFGQDGGGPELARSLCRTALAAARGADAERVARACADFAGGGGAAGFAQSQLNAVAAAPAAELPIAVRRLDLPKLATSAIMAGDTASVGQADWWAPAAGTTTTAAAMPPPALPGAPVDLRSPNWQEAFANRVQWLVDTQVGEARIKLNPPELGAVDVKISLVDDKTYVQLTTATAAARDELVAELAAAARAVHGQRARARRRQRAQRPRRARLPATVAGPVRRSRAAFAGVRRARRRACGRPRRAARSAVSTSSPERCQAAVRRRGAADAPIFRRFLFPPQLRNSSVLAR